MISIEYINPSRSSPSQPSQGFASRKTPPAILWPCLRGVSLRLVRLFAAGKRRSNPLVANYQRYLAPIRVVLGVGSASSFDQNGSGAREACTISKRLSFIILVVRVGQASLSPMIRGVLLRLVRSFAGLSQPPAKMGFSPRRRAHFKNMRFHNLLNVPTQRRD